MGVGGGRLPLGVSAGAVPLVRGVSFWVRLVSLCRGDLWGGCRFRCVWCRCAVGLGGWRVAFRCAGLSGVVSSGVTSCRVALRRVVSCRVASSHVVDRSP